VTDRQVSYLPSGRLSTDKRRAPCVRCGKKVHTTFTSKEPMCVPCRTGKSSESQKVRKSSRKTACGQCGAKMRSFSESPKCQSCRSVPDEERQRRQEVWAERRAARIPDYAAVEFVAQGATLELNPASLALLVRKLSDRIVKPGDNTVDVMPGWHTARELGRRTGVAPEFISTIKSRLPAATRHRCPECRGYMWVLDKDGTVEDHGNGFLEQCAMVGRKWLEASA